MFYVHSTKKIYGKPLTCIGQCDEHIRQRGPLASVRVVTLDRLEVITACRPATCHHLATQRSSIEPASRLLHVWPR